MYFGSIKFFKHLIYLCIVLVLFLTIVGFTTVIGWCIPDGNDETTEIVDNNSSINNSTSNNKVDEQNDNDDLTSKTDLTDPKENIISEKDKTDSSSETDSEVKTVHSKTAYLTIDDGPSSHTEDILDFLDKKKIKATFFIVTGYKSDFDILNEIVDRGHTLGLHSNSHDYKIIYESVDAFMKDLDAEKKIILDNTGIEPKIIRLPGGSINSYNTTTSAKIIEKLTEEKYKIFDWNVSLQDAQDITNDKMLEYANFSYELVEGKNLVILSHDCKYSDRTIEALDVFIDKLQNDGYTFDTLNENVDSLLFTYK